MINPILNAFPNEITVQDIRYTVNTDFRLWLQLFLFSRKKDSKKVDEILHSICPEIEESENPQAIVDALVDFSMLAEHLPKNEDKKKAKSRFNSTSKKLFDMFVDSDVIYADFVRDYNIDLNTAEMHWLRFKLLLNCLTEKSATEQRKSFRATDIKDVAAKNRDAVKASQEAISIADESPKMTLEERNKAMIDYVKSRQKEAHTGEAKD